MTERLCSIYFEEFLEVFKIDIRVQFNIQNRNYVTSKCNFCFNEIVCHARRPIQNSQLEKLTKEVEEMRTLLLSMIEDRKVK